MIPMFYKAVKDFRLCKALWLVASLVCTCMRKAYERGRVERCAQVVTTLQGIGRPERLPIYRLSPLTNM